MAAVRHDLGQRHRNGLPDPGFAPSPEPAIDGVPVAIFGRHVAPRSAAAEPPQDTVDDRAALLGRPASTTVLRLDGQQTLQNAPFCFSEIAPAQACLQKAALNQSELIASMKNRHQRAVVVRSAPHRLHRFAGHGTPMKPLINKDLPQDGHAITKERIPPISTHASPSGTITANIV